ncbi:hypothetical protein FISHEDRAFT_58749 [Fistulina hepatica ATCC 64428]|uniref:Uncharacterized protein n=1 Tax=Fistulina hepatica ATCC 64428 TaxID=1128425 RepID=A0A0D7ACV6_9AGAR|nr:hypothetical protein FISHEDRAFT_58749 [Fistulina hepatica ATCC 64428]
MDEERVINTLRSHTVIMGHGSHVDVPHAAFPVVAQVALDTHKQGCNLEPCVQGHAGSVAKQRDVKAVPDYPWLLALSQQLAAASISEDSAVGVGARSNKLAHPVIFDHVLTSLACDMPSQDAMPLFTLHVWDDDVAPLLRSAGVHIGGENEGECMPLDGGTVTDLDGTHTMDEATIEVFEPGQRDQQARPHASSSSSLESGQGSPPGKRARTAEVHAPHYKKPSFKQRHGHLPCKEHARLLQEENRRMQQCCKGTNHNRWKIVQDLRSAWTSGKIWEVVCTFLRVPFLDDIEHQPPTLIVDTIGRLVAVRSSIGGWMRELMPSIIADHCALVQACQHPMDRFNNLRGLHWASIMGHHHNTQPVSGSSFLVMPPGLIGSSAAANLEPISPTQLGHSGSSHVYRELSTLEERHGIMPLFGLYWNYCVNHTLPHLGVKRVFCVPHADWKNLALAVCAIFIYESEEEPQKQGDGTSLYRNADWANANGRGSCVWFNQASMFTSELDVDSIAKAIHQGLDGKCDKDALLAAGLFPTIIN